MRQRQYEIFEPRVDETERQIAMMKSAVDRLLGEVVESVVHPSHVPLEAEAETAEIQGTADAGPRGGLLGNHHNARMARVGLTIEFLEKRNRREILVAAVDVWNPFAPLAAVVEVEHRGNRVDANSVGMKFFKPVLRTSSRPKLKMKVFHSGWKPWRGSICSNSALPSKRPSPNASVGK